MSNCTEQGCPAGDDPHDHVYLLTYHRWVNIHGYVSSVQCAYLNEDDCIEECNERMKQIENSKVSDAHFTSEPVWIAGGFKVTADKKRG